MILLLAITVYYYVLKFLKHPKVFVVQILKFILKCSTMKFHLTRVCGNTQEHQLRTKWFLGPKNIEKHWCKHSEHVQTGSVKGKLIWGSLDFKNCKFGVFEWVWMSYFRVFECLLEYEGPPPAPKIHFAPCREKFLRTIMGSRSATPCHFSYKV